MAGKTRFKLEVRSTGLIEILDKVTAGTPNPTMFKFSTPDFDGTEFRKKFEALKEKNIVFLEFAPKRMKA